MDKWGFCIGVNGGAGLGLLLGSELSGTFITILGSALVLLSLISMGVLALKGKK